MYLKSYFLILNLIFAFFSFASFEFGAGTTSATAGRMIPSLNSSFTWGDSAISVFSTGVQTKLYYHSAHSISYYKTWNSGDFIFGSVRSGFGAGLLISSLGFQDTNSSTETKATDFAFGPAFHVNWTMYGPVYLNLEALYGIRELGSNLSLNFQDMVSLSLGVRI